MSSQASPARKESSEVEQGVLEMSSSLPSSSSGRFSSANEDSSTRIQVVISPDPNQSHAHTPFIGTSTAASLQDESIGVNKKTPPTDLASLKGKLYTFALEDNWDGAKSIFGEFPRMIPMELTVNGDTALHVAARTNNITFVQELVNLKLMTPKDLEITNSDGNTAFCIAAIFGHGDLCRTMIEKNKNLSQIRGPDEMLPIHLAALNGHRKTVQDLSTEDQLKEITDKDIGRLFLMTISSGLYDVATKLLEKYPASLVTAKDDQEQTALHMLARKPSQEFDTQDDNNEAASSGLRDKLQLLQRLSNCVRQLEYKKALDLTTKPSKVLFEAVKSGSIDTVKCLIDTIPELLEQRESNGQNILHIAALYRKLDIFDLILPKRGTASLLIREVDKDRNNVLHFAAQLSDERPSNLRRSILLPQELIWFEEVKKRVPPELRIMRNSKGETPKSTFSADHEMLLKEAQETAKAIAGPCMLVATLIATVVFPAALTVPGGDSTNPWFMPFFFANAAALFTACASIIFLLTIYTSSWWLTENESFISLRRRLTLGLRLLNISVDAMIIALILASWMIFQQYWARVVVFTMSLPAFMALFYLQYAALLYDLKTQMGIVGGREIRKLKNFIVPSK